MKKQSPDIAELVRGKWLNDLNFIRRLIRSWGTTTVNGEEVLVNRRYFFPVTHPDRDESFVKFAKLIKAYSDLEDPKMKGVVDAWLYFNPSKFSNNVILDDVIANNIRSTLWETGGVLNEGEVLRTSVVISSPLATGNSKLSYLNSLLENFSSPTFVAGIESKQALISEIEATYSTLWETYNIESGTSFEVIGSSGHVIADITPNDVWIQTLSRYILFSTDIPYTITNVQNGTNRNNTNIISTFIVDIDIPAFSINENTDITIKITEDLNNSLAGNDIITKQTLYGSDYQDLEVPDNVRVVENTRTLVDVSGLEGLTWERSGNSYYIRTDYLLDNSIPVAERLNTVLGCLDTGYRKKKPKWYQKLLATTIFIIVVVITYIALGGPAAVETGAKLFALASAIIMGSLVLSIITAVAYQSGNYGLADAFSSLNKTIEPLVFIAQIITIYNFIQNLARTGAESLSADSARAAASEAALREGATQLSKEIIQKEIEVILKERFVEALIEGIKVQFSDILAITASDISLSHVTKMTDMVFGLYSKNDISKRQERIQKLQDQYNDMREEIAEANAQNDMIAVLSSLIYRPLALDRSVYAEQFDLPYEHTGTKFHIGNICKTSVKALRLTV